MNWCNTIFYWQFGLFSYLLLCDFLYGSICAGEEEVGGGGGGGGDGGRNRDTFLLRDFPYNAVACIPSTSYG